MEKNENLDLCRECGGRCCKHSGCDYAASDFKDLSFSNLCNILSEGKISIVSVLLTDKLPNGKKFTYPILLLRARNTNRDVVDLVSIRTRCTQLGETGCLYKDYEDRPSGAKNLTPQPGYENGDCFPIVDPLEIANTWLPYQKVLGRIVRKYTGMSIEDKIKEDVENFFEDIFQQNFDYVSDYEKKEIRSFAIDLAYRYPKEYNKVCEKYKEAKPVIYVKK